MVQNFEATKIYSRQSSPPPPHRLQCSGSQESFAADHLCGTGGSNGCQWSTIPHCGGPMCHHGPGPGPPPPPPPGMVATGPCMHGGPSIIPPLPLCNPCSSNFNSVPLPGPSTSSRWGPRTSCPIHSPFRQRVPNGSICSSHQVSFSFN